MQLPNPPAALPGAHSTPVTHSTTVSPSPVSSLKRNGFWVATGIAFLMLMGTGGMMLVGVGAVWWGATRSSPVSADTFSDLSKQRERIQDELDEKSRAMTKSLRSELPGTNIIKATPLVATSIRLFLLDNSALRCASGRPEVDVSASADGDDFRAIVSKPRYRFRQDWIAGVLLPIQ